ncbi:MAG: lipid II:glycine glycyltransferase FemX [Patescibacteria group bacterium]
MKIQEIKDEKIWQEFVSSFEMAQFLHSWQWGKFQESLGRKIWRFGVYQNDKLIAALMLIKNNLPFKKNYLYSPRFPILTQTVPAEIFLNKIEEVAKKENSIFWRVDLFNADIFKDVKFIKISDLQPSRTIILDLTKSEEEILEGMHPKTRYNIRLAEKRGVRVKISQKKEEIEIFLKLLEKTAQRDKFKIYPFKYYRKLLQLDKNFVKLFLAEYQGKIIAGNLMIFFADTSTYLHGASADEYRNVMAPYLLHWLAIKEAKRMCLKYYDFWGIDEKKWPGVTRFKKGFVNLKTGFEINYPGTFDLVFNQFWYKIYLLAKKFI